MQLSKSDITILNLLQSDLSLSRQDLADAAGVSTTTFWRRAREMEDAGLIRKRVALIDPDMIGWTVCVLVFINLSDHEAKTRRAFESFVARSPFILECYSVTGSHDYTLIVRARSVPEFESFLLDEVLAQKAVDSAMSQFALRQHKYETKIEL